MNKDHYFKPGNKMSKGSTRPAVARIIDSLGLGENSIEAFEFMRDVMRGKIRDPSNADPNAYLHVPISERRHCAQWILERRYGKAQQNVSIETGERPPGQIDFSRFTDAELEAIEALHAKGVVDGEIVEAIASLPEGSENDR